MSRRAKSLNSLNRAKTGEDGKTGRREDGKTGRRKTGRREDGKTGEDGKTKTGRRVSQIRLPPLELGLSCTLEMMGAAGP